MGRTAIKFSAPVPPCAQKELQTGKGEKNKQESFSSLRSQEIVISAFVVDEFLE